LVGQLLAEGGGAATGGIIVDLSGALSTAGGGFAAGSIYEGRAWLAAFIESGRYV